jgi:hypothetical protein
MRNLSHECLSPCEKQPGNPNGAGEREDNGFNGRFSGKQQLLFHGYYYY